jgi:HK97 family phage major capsid protein
MGTVPDSEGVMTGGIMDNALKAVSMTEDELRVANYIVLFGGRDLEGEYFTESTDFESDYTKTGRLLVDWEHGFAPEGEPQRDNPLGYVDWDTAKTDTRGLFVVRVLSRRNQYMQYIKELIDAGLIGNSTEAVPSEVIKTEDGEIKKWGLKRDTFTVQPMEPRMLSENALQAYKALGLAELEPEAAPEGVKAGDAVKASDVGIETIKETNGGNEMSENENTQEFDVAAIAREAADEAVKAYRAQLEAEPPIKVASVMVEGPVQVTHDEADNPFDTLAEQARAVKSAAMGYNIDSRLKRLAMKAPTGANVGTPSQGGFLVEPTLTSEILTPLHEEGPFTRLANKMPVSGDSNYGWINGVDETSRADGSRWGGIRGYRLAEGADKTKSKPKFRRINWELKKYAVLVYATDELLADASLFSRIVNQGAGEELMFMANDDILNGNGAGGPAGILNSGALVSVAKETGQAAATVVTENLNKMWQRLHPRNKSRAAWFINSDVSPQLDDLALLAGTGALEPRYIRYGADGVMTIRGKPVYETEFSATLGTVGDILLADMSDYLFWEKGGVQAAVSIHVEFVADETVFRFVYRCDGQTSMAAPLTPYKGTANTQSAFVALATRA